MEYLQTQNNSQNVELNPVGPYVSVFMFVYYNLLISYLANK